MAATAKLKAINNMILDVSTPVHTALRSESTRTSTLSLGARHSGACTHSHRVKLEQPGKHIIQGGENYDQEEDSEGCHHSRHSRAAEDGRRRRRQTSYYQADPCSPIRAPPSTPHPNRCTCCTALPVAAITAHFSASRFTRRTTSTFGSGARACECTNHRGRRTHFGRTR